MAFEPDDKLRQIAEAYSLDGKDFAREAQYRVLQVGIDFNDPERGFAFRSANGSVVVDFLDWRAQCVRIRFDDVCVFSFRIAHEYGGFDGGAFVEILNSDELRRLRRDITEAPLRHFLLSTNDDEWCELVAGSYRVERSE